MPAYEELREYAINSDFINEVFKIVEKEQPDILKRAVAIIAKKYPDYYETVLVKSAIQQFRNEAVINASIQAKDN